MSKSSIKIRVMAKNGVTTVKTIINHPMETGLRKDKITGERIPAHFIQNLTCKINDVVIINVQWGVAVSRNPYLSIKYNGGKAGDIVKLSWEDNTGQSDSVEAIVNQESVS
jgi:sulfur-oxidizing protein SoxZ